MLEPRVAFAGPYRMHVLYPGEDGKVPECDCGKQHLTFGKSYYYCTCGLSAKQVSMGLEGERQAAQQWTSRWQPRAAGAASATVNATASACVPFHSHTPRSLTVKFPSLALVPPLLQPLCDGSHSGTIFKPQKFTVDKRQTFYLLCGW